MEKTCKICGKKYNAKQERSFFCSNACRQHSHRKKVAKTVIATEKKIEELRNTVSVTQDKFEQIVDKIRVMAIRIRGQEIVLKYKPDNIHAKKLLNELVREITLLNDLAIKMNNGKS